MSLLECSQASEAFVNFLSTMRVDSQKKQGEILALQNELQVSKSLKEEMDSKQGEILALQDKLQGTRTALMDYQNRSRAKFEKQQQELESYKTKMEEYKDETVSLQRQMQEMRVSSCKNCEFRRLIDGMAAAGSRENTDFDQESWWGQGRGEGRGRRRGEG